MKYEILTYKRLSAGSLERRQSALSTNPVQRQSPFYDTTMLTTTFECQPEPYDADANLYNRSLPELNSNRMHPNIGFGEHGQVASSASASSTPSTMDDSIHSPGSVQHEVESVLTRNGQPELPPSPYLPAGSVNFEQIQRHQQGQLQEPYAQRLLQDARQRQVQGQWQFQQVPNLVVLSCAVCTSPTVQLCEGCTSVGYCMPRPSDEGGY